MGKTIIPFLWIKCFFRDPFLNWPLFPKDISFWTKKTKVCTDDDNDDGHGDDDDDYHDSHILCDFFGVIFAFFLVQNFITKVLTVQKIYI